MQGALGSRLVFDESSWVLLWCWSPKFDHAGFIEFWSSMITLPRDVSRREADTPKLEQVYHVVYLVLECSHTENLAEVFWWEAGMSTSQSKKDTFWRNTGTDHLSKKLLAHIVPQRMRNFRCLARTLLPLKFSFRDDLPGRHAYHQRKQQSHISSAPSRSASEGFPSDSGHAAYR